MRFYIFALSASIIIGEACAMNVAVPYELLFFYHSYKAEFALLPQSKRTIGPRCGHTAGAANSAVELAITAQGLQGICTFDEFVRHVLIDLDRYTVDSHGNTIDPDSKVSANFDQANKASMRYIFKHIFPEVDLDDADKRAQPLLIEGLADAIQKARMTTEAGSAVLSRVALMLPKIAGYINIVSQYRISGQTEPKLKSLERLAGGEDKLWFRYVALSEHKILDLDGKTEIASYSDLDFDKTLANANAASDLTSKNKRVLKDWSTKYPLSDSKTTAHDNVIKATHYAHARISSADPSC
ncbi:hypothetical protein V494_00157 [Pseudogymnoascus sp. VKM F-4513 (FW-928)]|nr:hypothetical protein V494_00157 [Pseudogymnoascus sp. VKM F-4513 (FW-928)]